MHQQTHGWVAVFLAILSALIGVQATLARKAEHQILVTSLAASNSWNWYQAKATRQAFALDLVSVERYESEKREIAALAHMHESMRDMARRQSSEFDFAGGFLSSAIALAAFGMLLIGNPHRHRAALAVVIMAFFFAGTGATLIAHGFIIGLPQGTFALPNMDGIMAALPWRW